MVIAGVGKTTHRSQAVTEPSQGKDLACKNRNFASINIAHIGRDIYFHDDLPL